MLIICDYTQIQNTTEYNIQRKTKYVISQDEYYRSVGIECGTQLQRWTSHLNAHGGFGAVLEMLMR